MSFRHGNSSAGAAAATGIDAFSDAKAATIAGTGAVAMGNRDCTACAAAAADTLVQATRHGGGHHRAYKRHTEKNRDHLFHFHYPPSVFCRNRSTDILADHSYFHPFAFPHPEN